MARTVHRQPAGGLGEEAEPPPIAAPPAPAGAALEELAALVADLAAATGLGAGVWSAAGGAFLHRAGSPLAALIDAASPASPPCAGAVEALCRRVAATGAPAQAACPSGDEALEAWPVPGADGEPAAGVAFAARPSPDLALPAALVAARFGVGEAAVVEARRAAAAPDASRAQALLRAVARLAARPAASAAPAGPAAPPLAAPAPRPPAEAPGPRLEALLDILDEGVVVTDPDGLVVRTNPTARLLFDATPAVLHGRHVLDLLPGQPALQAAWRELARGRAARLEEEVRVPGRRLLDLRVTAAPLPAAPGGAAGYVVALRDLTRLRELQALRDDLVANLSHELRTPLASVRGFARAILEDATMAAGQRREFVELIDREADRLGRLIEDLLVMARLQAGRARAHPRRVDLRQHAAEVAGLFEKPCRDAGLALRVLLPEAVVPVMADEGLLGQLTHNLLGNALKFTPRGGVVEVSLEVAGGAARLAVRDTGVGIDPEAQPHVFDKFYREPRTARTIPGTGLGLAIVRRIADAHGWTVGLRSRVGEGTEAWVTVDLAPRAEEAP